MASDWSRCDEQGWLCRLIGIDTEMHQKNSTMSQLYCLVVEDVVSHKASAKLSAAKTSYLISREPKAWFHIVGIDVALSLKLVHEDNLKALVDYLVELASLPDALNESHETITVENIGCGGASVLIEPGEPLVMGSAGAKLWKDLPGWSMEVTECFQGPELWLDDTRSPEYCEIAKTKWQNFNTYLALRATNIAAQKIPVLANAISLARVTIVMALEYSPESRLGKDVKLHVPAAAEWFRIAGDQIEQLCKDGTEKMNPGDLWASQGGDERCDMSRMAFWKRRMSELGYGIGEEVIKNWCKGT